jgi:curved DNA-binding protein CbpA
MDLSKALTTLQMTKYNFNTTELKKAYLKQALLCHPDKTGNTPNNTHKFQDVKESYDFLMLYAENPTEYEEEKEYEPEQNPDEDLKGEYIKKENINLNMDILKMFIHNVLGGQYINTFIDILSGITDLTILLRDNISIETINKIKHFVNNYRLDIGGKRENNKEEENNINNLDLMSALKPYPTYTLNPSIDDLLDDNIYKLSINNKIYYVPLWHHECIYEDENGNEIIVNCNPLLDNNMYIDEKNNIYTSISISLNNKLLNEIYYINIGKKKYKLPMNLIYIQSNPQQICLYNCGILEMSDSDFYNNNSIRSNIYITITLI